ncbi:PREDICTED: uncharacterized protein LOC104734155 [Camelina sativa]|uniref:Uncharacterized protein LOC104734155 n=1 Tax=Camelina sativa TaxID=90675 RepID=A0ABM1QT53_CAMSA|nr:PREDICTED: uncharacterized protein LOC104734155 [Camelina sativa]
MDPLEHASSYRLLCPVERFEKDKDGKVTTISGKIHHIIKSSYFISDAEDEKSNHHHSLLLRNKKEGEEDKVIYYCWACQIEMIGKTYYFCSYCRNQYHKECVRSPSEIHSSDHPKHPLQLLWLPEPSQHTQCSSCRRAHHELFYYCSLCDFSLHPSCAEKPASLTINNPKRHMHTLHYFPRISTLICDVCGLDGDHGYLYVCLLCDFIVHKRCVDLPYVIKVSRHDHRLTFTCNLPYKDPTDCGVCHAKIKQNYGEYSCMKVGCVYAVHSRCAMQSDVCDGKELEGEPEKTYEKSQVFEDKGDGIIQHPTHPGHQLRLEKKIHNESKHCQACRLPCYDDADGGGGNVYRCLQCDDFILHESCAYIPRVKQFMLHVHPLILELSYTTSWFQCWKCRRYSCGFAYACGIQGMCNYMVLDTLCASISEPFHHHSHPHLLFVTSTQYDGEICSICQSWKPQPLNCVKCDFVLCFRCATLPHTARYQHDEHLLYFSYEEDAKDELYGCEICEEDIDPRKGLYSCNECGVTLHIDCLLGRDPYMKAGQTRTVNWDKTTVHVLPNTYSTRPICKTCRRRCPYKIKIVVSSQVDHPFCSFDCYYGE